MLQPALRLMNIRNVLPPVLLAEAVCIILLLILAFVVNIRYLVLIVVLARQLDLLPMLVING